MYVSGASESELIIIQTALRLSELEFIGTTNFVL
jgi:hypothetical protein